VALLMAVSHPRMVRVSGIVHGPGTYNPEGFDHLMARTCTICSNAEVTQINAELCAKQDSNRVIAQRHNLSPDALQRHKKCIEKQLARVAQTRDLAEVSTIESRVERALTRVEKWIERLDETDDYRAQTAHTRELRGLLELHGRLSGKLAPNPAVNINVAAQPPAGPSPLENYDSVDAEEIAADIAGALSPGKLAEVVLALQAQLPINTTAEVSQLAITQNPVIVPPLIR
jgi:hypothetical protein